jgi:apolipoprotein D and lipocalin family protein
MTLRAIFRAALWPLVAVMLVAVHGCGGRKAPALSTVDRVDLKRYAGRWYEIARYENSFERGLVAVTADYMLLPDGKVQVINSGRKGTLDGQLKSIRGTARAVDDSGARLKVTFFWPFEGDYWIIALDEDYQWAIVSEPCRRYLWILARQPHMEADLYNRLLAELNAFGFDTAKLQPTPQP